ncbi:MAG TPA: hypothetical protein VH877_18145 [Polyangia bacterium]|jgi:hypothetical protein|nr:hypothetical protein [Polyangia bacterium]
MDNIASPSSPAPLAVPPAGTAGPGSTTEIVVSPASEDFAARIAYDKFAPIAQTLAPERILPFRADASLARYNIQRGVNNVLPFRARIEEELPRVSFVQLMELPELAHGVLFAALQADVEYRSQGEIATLLAEGHPLRRKLLNSAVILVDDGIMPRDEVRAIQKGRGKLDTANDLVRLGDLFIRMRPKVEGKTSVTPAEAERAGFLGSRLQTLVQPENAVQARKTAPGLDELVGMRNRLWTVLVERHGLLWKVGAWLWGPDVDEYVPALQSRVVSRKDDEGKQEPPQTPPQAPPKSSSNLPKTL